MGSQVTGPALIDRARELIGIAFYHCGRSREGGIDCPGLILLPAWELGLTRFQPATYSPGGGMDQLEEALARECVRIDLAADASICRDPRHPALQPGDIAVFAIGVHYRHLAYLTGANPPTFIHAREERGVKESRLDEVWMGRLIGIYRWKALTGE